MDARKKDKLAAGTRTIAMGLLGLAAAFTLTAGEARAETAKVELPAAIKAGAQGPVLLGSPATGEGDRYDVFAFVERVADPNAKAAPPRPEADAGRHCFEFVAPGIGFVNPTTYLIDSTNDDGLTEGQVSRAVSEAFDAWNRQAPAPLFGGESQARPDGPEFDKPDGQNEISFADLGDDSIVSITVLWGRLAGRQDRLGIVEWDIVLNDAPFKWGDAGPTREAGLADPNVMDLLDVLTHEAGHILGLSHPGKSCTEETMFPSFLPGETKKRTLGNGDFDALVTLYGHPAGEIPDPEDPNADGSGADPR